MSWETESVVMLRHYINDLDPDSYSYSDERLQELFLVSAYKVVLDIYGTDTSSIVYSVDLEDFDITPDPATARDLGFMVLVAYNASATLCASEYKTSASQAISIRDGSSAIELKGIAKEKGAAAEFYKKNYEDALFKYQLTSRTAYQGILGPINVVTGGYYGNYTPSYDFRDRAMLT